MNTADGLGKSKTVLIDGKEYIISDLDIDSMAEIQRYIQKQKIKIWYEVATEMKLNEVEKNRQLHDIMKSSVSREELINFLDTLEGARLYFYYVLRKNNDVTLETINEIIRPDNLNAFSELVNSEANEHPPEVGAEASP